MEENPNDDLDNDVLTSANSFAGTLAKRHKEMIACAGGRYIGLPELQHKENIVREFSCSSEFT